MCGIAGIIGRNGERHIGSEMTRMLQSMKHRGPDSTGYALYGPPTDDWVMRVKLADANTPRDFDFHDDVLLERDPGALQDPVFPLRAARIAAYAPERVEIEVDAPADGMLVLTDTWYPGWRATRDGSELEVFRANGLFRAVRVPAGTSRVRFEYAPASFRWGVAISLASIGITALTVLIARRRQLYKGTASSR